MQIIVVEAAGAPFGLESGAVRASAPPAIVTPFPFAPSWAAEATLLNGRMTPIVAFTKRLGLIEPKRAPSEEQWFVVKTDDGEVLLRVDRTLETIDAEPVSLERLPSTERDVLLGSWPKTAHGLVSGVVMRNGLTTPTTRAVNFGTALWKNCEAERFSGLRASRTFVKGDTPSPFPEPPLSKSAEASAKTVMIVLTGEEQPYALSADRVYGLMSEAEAERARAPLPTPSPASEIEGAVRHRNRIWPVVSLARLLRRESASPRIVAPPLPCIGDPLRRRLALVTGRLTSGVGNGQEFGVALRVDEVSGARVYPRSRIYAGQEHSVLMSADGRSVGWLDIDRLVSERRSWRALLINGALITNSPSSVVPSPCPVLSPRLVMLRIGSVWYGLEEKKVERILEDRFLSTPGDGSDLMRAGIAYVDSEVLPVADLRRVLQPQQMVALRPRTTSSVLVMIRRAGTPWLIRVDQAGGLVHAATPPAEDSVPQEAHPNLPCAPDACWTGERWLPVLDLDLLPFPAEPMRRGCS
ncbi:hypothetical protein CCP2SC5_700012 [Azospirillaceae bacterium]